MTYTVSIGPIEEHIIPGKRLGRSVRHDSRSLAYPYRAGPGATPATVLHARRVPIFDQGNTGSCTGQAIVGACGTDPDWSDLPPRHPPLDEAEALRLYSAAELLDGDGPYPPFDNGSSGLSVCKAATDAGLIAGYTHALTLGDALVALQGGPIITGVNWYDCIAPDSRILTSDLRWTPIQKLSPGDEIIGFDEHSPGGRGRKYRRAHIVANDLVVKPTITISYDLGGQQRSVTVSDGHLFLVRNTNEMQTWRRADQLRLDDEVYSLVPPYEEDRSREAGWLAGFFDGEGSVGIGTHTDKGSRRRSYRLDIAQKVGPTLTELKHVLSGRDFDFQVQQVRQSNPAWKPLEVLWLRGGRPEILRFLGTIRPERLVSNGDVFWEDQAISSKSPSRAVVTGIKRTGQHELHAIGTSTGTLLVEGLLSHNSFDHPSSSGEIAISSGASVRGGHEFVVRGCDTALQTVRCDNSWGTSWADGGSFTMGWGTWERLLAEQGDVTVPIPAAQPPPVPIPVPVPTPPPAPGPAPGDADLTLAKTAVPWIGHRPPRRSQTMADALTVWLQARGLY